MQHRILCYFTLKFKTKTITYYQLNGQVNNVYLFLLATLILAFIVSLIRLVVLLSVNYYLIVIKYCVICIIVILFDRVLRGVLTTILVVVIVIVVTLTIIVLLPVFVFIGHLVGFVLLIVFVIAVVNLLVDVVNVPANSIIV